MSAEPTDRVYLYGVVRGQVTGPLPGLTPIDGDGDVYGIGHQGLTAIVSDARRERYEVSRRHVTGHEAVVVALMERHDVLPARFGGVQSRAQVRDELLVRHYPTLHTQIDRLAGMVELTLKVSWADLQAVIAEIVANDPKLQQARRRMAGGGLSRNLRLDTGKRVDRALAAIGAAEGVDIVHTLAHRTAGDGVRHSGHSEEAKVLDAAFLVSRDHVGLFREAVAGYDRARTERYRMRLGNPAAPYSFVAALESPVPHPHRVGR